MKSYIACYDLHVPGQKYEEVKSIIASYPSSLAIQQSVWVVTSELTADQIRDSVYSTLDDGDVLLVTEMGPDASWANYNEEFSSWFQAVRAG